MRLLKVRSVTTGDEVGEVAVTPITQPTPVTQNTQNPPAPRRKGRGGLSRAAFTAYASAFFTAGVTYHGGPVDTSAIDRLPIGDGEKIKVLDEFEKLKASAGSAKEDRLYELLTDLTRLAGY